jgi:hypothetical protein
MPWSTELPKLTSIPFSSSVGDLEARLRDAGLRPPTDLSGSSTRSGLATDAVAAILETVTRSEGILRGIQRQAAAERAERQRQERLRDLEMQWKMLQANVSAGIVLGGAALRYLFNSPEDARQFEQLANGVAAMAFAASATPSNASSIVQLAQFARGAELVFSALQAGPSFEQSTLEG